MASGGKSTVEAGYGQEHRRERARWQPLVLAGGVPCHAARCIEPGGRIISPGSSWDLGHDPARTRWTGPEHSRCNRSEAGKRGNPKGQPRRRGSRRRRYLPWTTTQDW